MGNTSRNDELYENQLVLLSKLSKAERRKVYMYISSSIPNSCLGKCTYILVKWLNGQAVKTLPLHGKVGGFDSPLSQQGDTVFDKRLPMIEYQKA